MRKEIDILLLAASKRCAIVEKASNRRWGPEDLAGARESGCYQEPGDLLPPDERIAVTRAYPGCMQQAGASADDLGYRLIGQTEHFVIFAPHERSTRLAGGRSMRASSNPGVNLTRV